MRVIVEKWNIFYHSVLFACSLVLHIYILNSDNEPEFTREIPMIAVQLGYLLTVGLTNTGS